MNASWCEGWLQPSAHLRHDPSPHFDARPAEVVVDTVVIHNISLPAGEFGSGHALDILCGRLNTNAHPDFAVLAGLRVSSHFFIDRLGQVVQCVGCDQRAWHAGQSSYRGREAYNDFSIGIELEGCDFLPFEPAQYDSLNLLFVSLRQGYPLTQAVGHSTISPGRKTDPGPCFDWQKLTQLGSLKLP